MQPTLKMEYTVIPKRQCLTEDMDVSEKLTNNISFYKRFNSNKIDFCLTELIYLFFKFKFTSITLFFRYRLLTEATFVELYDIMDILVEKH